MNFLNKYAKVMRNSGPARFFVPLGLILIIFGVILLGMKTGGYVRTTGIVTAVTPGVPDDNNDPTYDVEFTYTAEDGKHTGSFSGLGGDYKEGDAIDVFYNPENPSQITNTKAGNFLGPVLLVVGALAIGFGVLKTVQAFRKSRELDAALPGGDFPKEAFEGFKTAPGVRELYFLFDGHALKPGYLIEDGDRKVLFEGEMLKNALVGARVFEFRNRVSGLTEEHQVGHAVTQTYNDGLFSVKSSFKVDGKNIWDLLHDRGVRISTDLFARFPNVAYDVIRNGAPFARIESCGVHVHEEDAAAHTLNVPSGRHYRCWTSSDDLETLFLTVFAFAETEQTVAE